MGSVTLSSNTDITFQISYVLQIHASNTRVTYTYCIAATDGFATNVASSKLVM